MQLVCIVHAVYNVQLKFSVYVNMVKEAGGAVILLLTSAQYLSGMPAALNSANLRCLISSNFLRLQGVRMKS